MWAKGRELIAQFPLDLKPGEAFVLTGKMASRIGESDDEILRAESKDVIPELPPGKRNGFVDEPLKGLSVSQGA